MPEIYAAQMIPSEYANYAIAILFGYLMGSVSFPRMINHLSLSENVPETSDGKIRAIDIYEAGFKTLAIVAVLGDIVKGFLAAAMPAATWGVVPAILATFGAFLGHQYPAFANFKGGSGIAPYFGALCLFHYESAAIMGLIWVLTLLVSRYTTLACVLSVVMTPFILMSFEQWPYVQLFGGLAALVVVRNITNLFRLYHGHEPQVKF